MLEREFKLVLTVNPDLVVDRREQSKHVGLTKGRLALVQPHTAHQKGWIEYKSESEKHQSKHTTIGYG